MHQIFSTRLIIDITTAYTNLPALSSMDGLRGFSFSNDFSEKYIIKMSRTLKRSKFCCVKDSFNFYYKKQSTRKQQAKNLFTILHKLQRKKFQFINFREFSLRKRIKKEKKRQSKVFNCKVLIQV